MTGNYIANKSPMAKATVNNSNWLQLLSSETSDLVAITNTRLEIEWVNAQFIKTTGFLSDEIAGKNIFNLLRGSHTSAERGKQILNLAEERGSFEGIILFYTASEKALWCSLKVKPVEEDGNFIGYLLILSDISRRVNQNEELLYNEFRWKFALEQSGDGYFEYDFTTGKFFGSENILNVLGITDNAHDINFQSLVKIIHPNDSEAAVNSLFDLIENRNNLIRQEFRIKNENGKYHWVVALATVSAYNDQGKALNLLGTITDISRLKETEEQLVKAKLLAEQASAHKNQFLSTISHEIRTPLNAIIGLTNVMLMNKPKGELQQNINTLSFSANHLLSLINDVLDLAKIEAGKLEFTQQDFSIAETVQGVYNTFLSRCKEKGITLTIKIDSKIPQYTCGDRLRLIQVLNNLVNNAVKFTSKGHVKITATLKRKTGKKAIVFFEVSDTGIGIAKGAQKKIFDSFTQASNSITANFGGTGLGLAITKKLITLQGGKIGLSSTEGKGSAFHFELPFEISTAQKSSSKQKPTTNLKGAKVLIAEDVLVNQKVVTAYLNNWGAKSTCTVNGKKMLEAFNKGKYDILLVDLFMPVMDGFATIQKVRETKKGKETPIIALTASADTVSLQKAITAGADRCVTKPFEPTQLLTTIQELLKIKKAAITADTEKPTTVSKNKFKHINLKKLNEASLGKKTFLKEMLALIQQEIPGHITACQNSLKKKNYNAVANAMHKLKNSMLLLGMDSLENDLKNAENIARTNKDVAKLPSLLTRIVAKWELAQKELKSIH